MSHSNDAENIDSNSKLLSLAKYRELWTLCSRFMIDNKVRSGESIFQNDRTYEYCPELVADIGEIVGWYESEEEDW